MGCEMNAGAGLPTTVDIQGIGTVSGRVFLYP
jgi:hypothetical protein